MTRDLQVGPQYEGWDEMHELAFAAISARGRTDTVAGLFEVVMDDIHAQILEGGNVDDITERLANLADAAGQIAQVAIIGLAEADYDGDFARALEAVREAIAHGREAQDE